MKEIRGTIRSMLGKILIGISGALLLATVGLVIVQKSSPQELPTSPGNTPISWASNQLDVVMFPGTSTTTKVSFRSSQALTDLNVSLNPPLATIASATPKIFYSIEPNKVYTVTLTLKAPPEFTKRSYGGVLALTDAHGVVSKPLQVGAQMDYQTFSDNTLGIVNLNYPQGWLLTSNGKDIAFSDKPLVSSPGFKEAEQTGKFVVSRLENVNPQKLPIDRWFTGYFKNGFSSEPENQHLITVGGRSSIYLELVEIGMRVHIFVPNNTDVLDVIYGLYTPTFVGTYESMERSIEF